MLFTEGYLWTELQFGIRRGKTVSVNKGTSIAAMPELLFQARQAQSVTYNATPIMAPAVAYFILLWPMVRLLSKLENKQLAKRA